MVEPDEPQAAVGSAAPASVPPPPALLPWSEAIVPLGASLAGKAVVLTLAYLLLGHPDWFWHRLSTNWDATHYVRIAKEGYQLHFQGPGDSPAFAFLYPLGIRLLGGSPLAAVLLDNAASLLAVAVIARQFGRKPATFFALFPPWLVFGTVAYSEGLYVALAALCLASLHASQRWRAGLAGALALTARYAGGPALLAAALATKRRSWRGWLVPIALVCASAAGVWLFLWHQTGSFFGFAAAERAWGGKFGWPWEHFDWLMHGWFTTQFGGVAQGNLGPIDLVVRDSLYLALFVAGLAVLWLRQDRPGFAYSGIILFVSLFTVGIPAAAFPRYLAGGFPAIAVLGHRLHTWLDWAGYATAAILVAAAGLSHHLAGYYS